MARTEIPIVVLDPTTGEYVEGAEAAIQIRPTGTAATVYTTEAGGTTATQPLETDAQGRVTGWVNRGRYQAVITHPDTSTATVYFDSAPGEAGAVTTDWIEDDAITQAKIADDAVGSAQLDEDAVNATHIVDGSVGASEIADGGVGTSELAADSVDSTKLKDDAVTDGNRAVTTNHIRNLNVTTGKIADDAVDNTKLKDSAGTDADRAVTTNHIRDKAVTSPKLFPSSAVGTSADGVGGYLTLTGSWNDTATMVSITPTYNASAFVFFSANAVLSSSNKILTVEAFTQLSVNGAPVGAEFRAGHTGKYDASGDNPILTIPISGTALINLNSGVTYNLAIGGYKVGSDSAVLQGNSGVSGKGLTLGYMLFAR